MLRKSTGGLPSDVQGCAWDKLSKRFAQKALRKIRFISVRGPIPRSTWIQLEEPILQARGMEIIKFIIKQNNINYSAIYRQWLIF